MSVDAFDRAYREWLHGVHCEAKARQEEANMIDLINGLQERGHHLTYDYLDRYIFVDAKLTITTQVARETKPETLLQWVEERVKQL